MKTHFNVIAIFILERSDFTTNPRARFVDFDFISLIQEFYSGGETSKTGTNNGHFEFWVSRLDDGSIWEKGSKRDILECYIVYITYIRGGRCLNSLRTDDDICTRTREKQLEKREGDRDSRCTMPAACATLDELAPQ